jgi:hypothetical protein
MKWLRSGETLRLHLLGILLITLFTETVIARELCSRVLTTYLRGLYSFEQGVIFYSG